MADLNGIQQEALKAARHAVRDRSVALVGFSETEPKGIGTGTCISIDGRYFIATAAHVILPYPNERLLVVNPTQAPLPIAGRGLRGGRDGDKDDIAWLELPEESARVKL